MSAASVGQQTRTEATAREAMRDTGLRVTSCTDLEYRAAQLAGRQALLRQQLADITDPRARRRVQQELTQLARWRSALTAYAAQLRATTPACRHCGRVGVPACTTACPADPHNRPGR